MTSSRRKRSPTVLQPLPVTTASTIRYDNSIFTGGPNPLDYLPNTASQAKVLLTRMINKTLKLHNTIANIHFNKQCLTDKVTPKYATINLKTNTLAARRTKITAERLMIKNEIRSLYIKKNNQNEELYRLHLETANSLTRLKLYHLFAPFLDYLKDRIHQQMTNKYNKTERKLTKLNKGQTKTNTTFHKRIANLTTINFTDSEEQLLERGLKHNLPQNNIRKTIETHILDAETAITYLPTERQEQVRHKVADILEHTIKQGTNHKHAHNEQKTINSIKTKLKDNELILTKADKGNVTVVMTKDDYITKTNTFITNTRCIKLNTDPTDTYQRQIRDTIKRNPHITDGPPYKYINMNPRPPTMRAQPKIHKTDIPIRPVINYRPAPAYRLAKHITNVLKETVNLPNTYTIRNTQDLTTRLQDVHITPNTVLVSFDIKDLYPSIPVNETLQIIRDKLTELFDADYINQLTDVLKTVLSQNYFQFNEQIYKPEDGLGMGNPTSSILTEVFLQHYEDLTIPTLTDKYKIKFYGRYVDDTLLIIEKDTTDELLTDLNKIHPHITYTMDKEQNKTINFLDLTITRNENSLTYGIYRKPTTTDTTIHSSSTHPTQHKLSAYRHMIRRLQTTPMTQENYNKELSTIYEIAQNNGYKRTTIDKLLTHNTTEKRTDIEGLTTRRCTFTYTGPLTYRLTNLFQKEGLRTALKTDNNLRSNLTNDIDRPNKYDLNGVYKLTCTCDQTYIGQTGRKLKTRYKEHLRSFRQNKRDSNFANHLHEHAHDPTNIQNSMTLLHRQQKGRRLDILENMEIYKQRHIKGNIINEQLNTSSDTIFRPLKLLKRTNKRKRTDTTVIQQIKRQRT